MGLKVLIAPDKFKGTLKAQAAAEAMQRGWAQERPQDHLELLPISDGGDGFGELISAALHGETCSTKTVDAAHRPCVAEWWWEPRTKTAIIETAGVVGLAQLPAGKYHPFELDTFGLGALFAAAIQRGARKCLVGIGGSATNDGGFGVGRAMGWTFFNERSGVIERWTELHSLSQFKIPAQERFFEELIVAVDVQNPLLGANGCTPVYGPQKGLRPEDFPFAERCLSRLVECVLRELHRDYAQTPGGGAAGGLGYGLRTFMEARLVPGFEVVTEYTGFAERLAGAQVVLTGEGCIDQSTLMGKGVGEVGLICQRRGIPCLAVAGAIPDPVSARKLFSSTTALTPDLTEAERALREPAVWLERAAARTAREWSARAAI